MCPQDLLEELSPQVLVALKNRLEKDRKAEKGKGTERQGSTVHLNRLEKNILQLVPLDRTLHIDCPLEQVGARREPLVTVLLDLEMKGLIRQFPGKRLTQILS